MITDLAEIHRLADAHHAEDIQFRRYVKQHHCPEELFHVIAAEVEQQIDCTACSNCCREMLVSVTADEVERIATYLKLEPSEVMRQYVLRDPEDSRKLILRNEGGCVFLDGGLCLVYDARPRPCREFPHSHLHERTLGGRMESQCRRACVCPIVYNALEQYKHAIGFRLRHIPHR